MSQLEHEEDAVLVKLLAAASGVAATFVANAVIRHVWKAATGHNPPKNANDPSLQLLQAVGFAALSAAVAVLTKRLATHGASAALRQVGKHSSTEELANHLVTEALNRHK